MFKNSVTFSIYSLCKSYIHIGIISIFLTIISSALEISITYLVLPLTQILGANRSSIISHQSNLLEKITHFYSFFPHRWHLLVILITLFGLTIIKSLSLYLSSICINDFTLRCGNNLREECVKQFLRMEMSYYNQTSTGKLLSYVNEQAQRSERLFSSYLEIAREIVLTTAFICFLIFLSPVLTLATVLSLILIVGSLKILIKSIEIHGHKSAKAIEQFSSLVAEIIIGMRVIKSFNAESRELLRSKQSLSERYTAELTTFKFLSASAPLTETSGILLLLIIIALGSYLLSPNNGITLPLLLTYTLALIRTLPRVNQLNSLRSNLSLNMGSFIEIHNFLSETEKAYLPNGTFHYQGLREALVLKNLFFSYCDSEKITLNNINLRIEKGKTVALVGSSGSGKSTLADLIMRFYDPDKGEILVDGINLRQLNLNSWRQRIAIVNQDTFLFNASVRENITYGRPDAKDSELFEAAKKAYAYDFIQELPQRFNTIVGNRGTKLSGGQRQRIAIARAILCKPDILILDEATSALDSHSEKLVQEAIDKISQGRTVIIIAHRLSTIEKADNIIVLDQGQVVEQGSKEELLNLQGFYCALYKSQKS